MGLCFLLTCLLHSYDSAIQCQALSGYVRHSNFERCNMAKVKEKVKGRRKRRGRISSYFRPILEAEPGLLYGTSNADLIGRWTKTHPNHTAKMLKKVKQNLANLKSQMRKKDR